MTDSGKLTPDAYRSQLDTPDLPRRRALSWSSSAHAGGGLHLARLICRDLMRYLGTGSGLISSSCIPSRTARATSSTACVSCAIMAPAPPPTHVVMVDSARRYQAQTRRLPSTAAFRQALLAYCLLGALLLLTSFWSLPPAYHGTPD